MSLYQYLRGGRVYYPSSDPLRLLFLREVIRCSFPPLLKQRSSPPLGMLQQGRLSLVSCLSWEHPGRSVRKSLQADTNSPDAFSSQGCCTLRLAQYSAFSNLMIILSEFLPAVLRPYLPPIASGKPVLMSSPCRGLCVSMKFRLIGCPVTSVL